jgi:hypothetical protein
MMRARPLLILEHADDLREVEQLLLGQVDRRDHRAKRDMVRDQRLAVGPAVPVTTLSCGAFRAARRPASPRLAPSSTP